MNSVGVAAVFHLQNPASKRALILFDRLVVDTALIPDPELLPSSKDAVPPQAGLTSNALIDALFGAGLVEIATLEELDNLTSEELEEPSIIERFEGYDDVMPPPQTMLALDSYACELARVAVVRDDEHAVPLLYRSDILRSTPTDSRIAALRVALKRLPLPDAATPWRAILDWRADEDARIKLRRLKAWVNRLVRSGFEASDVDDELATLLDDYERYMALQHRRMSRTWIDVVVTTTAEISEAALTFKFSKLAARLCGVLSDTVKLAEADLQAPGREVAYIHDARKQFNRGLTSR
jgi:hypothetical protein